MVAYLDQYPLVTDFGSDIDKRNAGFRRFAIAAGIFDQIGDHAQQLGLVGQHIETGRNRHRDAQVFVVGYGIHGSIDDGIERDRCQLRRVRPRIVEEFVNDGVELRDVGRHVGACIDIGHAHFGFQPQARKRGAQIVRNASQHDDPVLLDFRQLLGHPVEADVDFADLAGGGFLVEQAGVEIAVAHAACSE